MAISTTPTEIDRKLHRIVAEADPDKHATAVSIARSLVSQRAPAFSYQRNGRTEHAGENTIAQYVVFAKKIGMLDGDLSPTRTKSEVRSLDNFQSWLSDLAIQFLDQNSASLDDIERITRQLLDQSPRRLPTIDNIHAAIQNPPGKSGAHPNVLGKEDLRLSLKVVALLRPKALRLVSRRLVIVPVVVAG